jgi:nucleoside-diphosphate-sugar epimerase
LPFPRQAFTDWYHWSKVYDSGNVSLACKIWSLRVTDIMQGVVYGLNTYDPAEEKLLTRFDFDSVFGTVINRFCAQAVVGRPVSIYGTGNQKRPVISLSDAIQCIKLLAHNPAKVGEYRVVHQFSEVHTIKDFATIIQGVGKALGMAVNIISVPNPRVEHEEASYYNPVSEVLPGLGFVPHRLIRDELQRTMPVLARYKDRLLDKQHTIEARVDWRQAALGDN